MALAARFSLLHSDLNDFLFASVGEEQNGVTLSVVSALTRLGPTYVKLGQFLATRPDVVGPALARDLESLQDRMAPFPQAEAEAQVAAAET